MIIYYYLFSFLDHCFIIVVVLVVAFVFSFMNTVIPFPHLFRCSVIVEVVVSLKLTSNFKDLFLKNIENILATVDRKSEFEFES